MALPWPKIFMAPQVAKNVYGPPMAKNIYGPQMAKNIYGPPMAQKTDLCMIQDSNTFNQDKWSSLNKSDQFGSSLNQFDQVWSTDLCMIQDSKTHY